MKLYHHYKTLLHLGLIAIALLVFLVFLEGWIYENWIIGNRL
jgi:hypothetical protein